MAGHALHVFAVNEPLEGQHTYLSRAKGEVAELPDLASWLGVQQDGIDTDEIELFPTADLAGMTLTDYARMAFDLEADPDDQTSARINALEGHVLLIPDIALAAETSPNPQLTQIATLSLARPDHSSDALAAVAPPTSTESVLSTQAAAPSGRGSTAFVLTIVIGILTAVIILYLMAG